MGRVYTGFAGYHTKLRMLELIMFLPPYLHIGIGLMALLYTVRFRARLRVYSQIYSFAFKNYVRQRAIFDHISLVSS